MGLVGHGAAPLAAITYNVVNLLEGRVQLPTTVQRALPYEGCSCAGSLSGQIRMHTPPPVNPPLCVSASLFISLAGSLVAQAILAEQQQQPQKQQEWKQEQQQQPQPPQQQQQQPQPQELQRRQTGVGPRVCLECGSTKPKGKSWLRHAVTKAEWLCKPCYNKSLQTAKNGWQQQPKAWRRARVPQPDSPQSALPQPAELQPALPQQAELQSALPQPPQLVPPQSAPPPPQPASLPQPQQPQQQPQPTDTELQINVLIDGGKEWLKLGAPDHIVLQMMLRASLACGMARRRLSEMEATRSK